MHEMRVTLPIATAADATAVTPTIATAADSTAVMPTIATAADATAVTPTISATDATGREARVGDDPARRRPAALETSSPRSGAVAS